MRKLARALVMLVLVALILSFSFLFKEKVVRWKDLVLQRVEEKTKVLKQLQAATEGTLLCSLLGYHLRFTISPSPVFRSMNIA